MNKKGFTLMEIIVVIALLGAIMLLVVPNITKNFKESKKRLFYDNVVSLYTSAGRSFLLLDNTSNKTFSNSGNTLDVDVSEDITYKIVVNSYGEVTSMYVTNGTYSYSKSNSNGIKKKDIKLDDIIEGTGDEDASAKVTLFDKLLEDNPTISERTDFSTAFTTNTANTLYKATENGTDVYYFAGQDTASTPINNWVKFGGFYWRIIRTNADGSIRLLYHGTSTAATDAYIGTSKFNEKSRDSMYVGYMYGTSGSQESNRTNTNDSTIKTSIDNWYASNMTSYTKYLSPTAVYCNDREVATGSTYKVAKYIKNDTETLIAYLDPSDTKTAVETLPEIDSANFKFKPYERLYTNKTPTYDCTNNNDKFTVDASTGNGKLTYPIALMTADEIAYAGGVQSQNASTMWYYTNSSFESSTGSIWWWSLSPYSWIGSDALSWIVYDSDNPGDLNYRVSLLRGVRTVVSLKSCIKYSTGNGTSETPYEIVENGGC